MYVPSSEQNKSLTFFSILCSLAVIVSYLIASNTTISSISLMPPHTANASVLALSSNVVITTLVHWHSPVKCLVWKNSAKENRMLITWVTKQLDCQLSHIASKRWCDIVRKCLADMLCLGFGHELEQDFFLYSLGETFLHKFILTSETACTWIRQTVHLISFSCC